MVQVTVGRVGELQGAEADVVESFVVDAVGFVRVLNQLVDREGGVVGLDHSVRYLRGKVGSLAHRSHMCQANAEVVFLILYEPCLIQQQA